MISLNIQKKFTVYFKSKKLYLGQTRLNIENKIAKIDYSIDKDQKRGLGLEMLASILKKII